MSSPELLESVKLSDGRSLSFARFGDPGRENGTPDAHFEDFWDCCDFGDVFSTRS